METLENILTDFETRLADYPTSDSSFFDYIESLLQDYKNTISSSNISFNGIIPKTSVIIDKVSILCDSIIETLRYYIFESSIDGKAYKIFEEGLKNGGIITEVLLRNKEEKAPFSKFYRLRASKEDTNLYTKTELFHIGFDERGKASTQRFSLPGFPMLYLCNSIYTGWREIQKPRYFQAVQYENTINSLELIHLSAIPYLQRKDEIYRKYTLSITQYNEICKLLSNSALLFPLIAACLSKVPIKHLNHSIKFEYVIPQFFLELIRKEIHLYNIDGIVYSSTQIGASSLKENGQFKNFVIPTKTNTSNGYCSELTQKFQSTETKKLQISENIDMEVSATHFCTEVKKITFENNSLDYKNTLFAHTENALYNSINTPFI